MKKPNEVPYSAYAQFHLALKGWDVFYNTRKMCKFELWERHRHNRTHVEQLKRREHPQYLFKMNPAYHNFLREHDLKQRKDYERQKKLPKGKRSTFLLVG